MTSDVFTHEPNYEGLSEEDVFTLQGFEVPLGNTVRRLLDISEKLEADTPSAGRRSILREAAEASPKIPDLAAYVVGQVNTLAEGDPKLLLGFVRGIEAALKKEFEKPTKEYVDARMEELEANTETSAKLSDEERNALVEAYQKPYKQFTTFIKMLTDNTNGGERLVAVLPKITAHRVSSGPRKPGGPRIGGFEFRVSGSTVAKDFPGLAKFFNKLEEGDRHSSLSLKQTVARQNEVDPDNEEAFKALFKSLSGQDSWSFRVADPSGESVLVVAVKPEDDDVDTDASDDETEDDE